MNVGCTSPRLSTILSMGPSTAVAKPMRSWTVISTLPKTWLSGNQRYWTSSGLMMSNSSIATPSYVQLSCSSCTPLGRPVVPDV